MFAFEAACSAKKGGHGGVGGRAQPADGWREGGRAGLYCRFSRSLYTHAEVFFLFSFLFVTRVARQRRLRLGYLSLRAGLEFEDWS